MLTRHGLLGTRADSSPTSNVGATRSEPRHDRQSSHRPAPPRRAPRLIPTPKPPANRRAEPSGANASSPPTGHIRPKSGHIRPKSGHIGAETGHIRQKTGHIGPPGWTHRRHSPSSRRLQPGPSAMINPSAICHPVRTRIPSAHPHPLRSHSSTLCPLPFPTEHIGPKTEHIGGKH